MGRDSIQSWSKGINGHGDDEDVEKGLSSGAKWDRTEGGWKPYLSGVRTALLSGSTKLRVNVLEKELVQLVLEQNLSMSHIADIFELLTLTYPRYVDRASRDAAETLGVQILKGDEQRANKYGITEHIISWLNVESNRICGKGAQSSTAPTNFFTLLNWSCALYTTCLGVSPKFPKDQSQSWSKLIGSMVVLLDALLNPLTGGKSKSSLRKSGIDRARRAIRSYPLVIPEVISAILSETPSPSKAPFLGLVIDVILHLKNYKGPEILPSVKTSIKRFYIEQLIVSKTALPPHQATALEGFVRACVTEDDLSDSILSAMERSLLRAPENALPVCAAFFEGYNGTLGQPTFNRILTAILNNSKSNNASTRAAAVDLFKSIFKPAVPSASISEDSTALHVHAITELLALPKASKSASAEHRVALYTMAEFIPPGEEVSAKIQSSAEVLLSKETIDAALGAFCKSLDVHLSWSLKHGHKLEKGVIQALVKELTSNKPATRRALWGLIGRLVLSGHADADASAVANGTIVPEGLKEFELALLPALEANLKAMAGISPNSPGGVLEGYVAVSSLLGAVGLWAPDKSEEIVGRNPVPFNFNAQGSKASFLVWDKIYQKLGEEEEQKWLLRALEAVIRYRDGVLVNTTGARKLLGLTLTFCAVDSQHVQIRRDSIRTQINLVHVNPVLTTDAMIYALEECITRSALHASGEGTEARTRYQQRMLVVLSSCSAFGENVGVEVKESLLMRSLIMAHHPHIGGSDRQCWVDMIQKSSIDPRDLVASKIAILADIVCPPNPSVEEDPATKVARHRAITTLSFLHPEVALPVFLDRLDGYMDTTSASALTQEQMDIWRTPEGTAFVNVLGRKETAVNRKGKEVEIQKWEAEVRQTLANKKPPASKLSKQEEALLQAQLAKEKRIRQEVESLKQCLIEGLYIVHSLVDTRLEVFQNYISRIAGLVITSAMGRPAELLGNLPFDAFIKLGACCEERFTSIGHWAGIAILRAIDSPCVPENLRAEPLEQLTLRVLYRCCTLAEQAPLNVATLSFIHPLLTQIALKGGVEPADLDTALEQLTLVLNLLRFQVGEVSNIALPRLGMMSNVTRILSNHLQLAKESASLLVSIGEGIYMNTTREEIDFLLKSTLVEESHARNAVLQALQPLDLTDLDWAPELWISCHDYDEQNARLAQHIWDDNGLDIVEQYREALFELLCHDSKAVRSITSASFVDAVESWPTSINTLVLALERLYVEKVPDEGPKYDNFGLLISDPSAIIDPWTTREAVAQTLETLAPYLSEELVHSMFKFLIADRALGDKNGNVRRAMLKVGVKIVDTQGSLYISSLMELFEGNLAILSSSDSEDRIREAIIVLFGRLARHLEKGDDRLPTIVDRLVQALKTPSESVQQAVSECLGPLIVDISDPDKLVYKLLTQSTSAARYAERRGAAYGLAGVVQGLGISAMKKYNILERLRQSLEEKKQSESRQGAMFNVETLAMTLGRLFEPFITQVLPLLLIAFGDATPDVREAATDASKALMSNVSGFGVKLILPTLLSGLDEKQWRTKKGAIELLGAMAYCSPRQLSLSLPTVIPRLTGVLTDSHAQVRTAANKSLKQFGEVISNPEIQQLVPVLLKGLVDPDKIPSALSSLLKTSFMHYIDSPSLALVIPILERGLKQRGESKKQACRIVGNMASLTDPKDFVPYLQRLMTLMHIVLVDPVPEARATAAKALGTLVERLGEINFPDLVPSLLQTLKSDTSAVDRQGAAQGLSEVLSGLGMERLEGLLPDIISNSTSSRRYVREGFMSLLVYLPATFGTRFQPHLPKIITPILTGIADTEQTVQDTAMRAGRMIIVNYSNRAIDLLLPELEITLFDESWRIRQSSLTLIGELLFKISGISGKTEVEEEENEEEHTVTESLKKVLSDTLGQSRRDQLLSAFYILRQDAVTLVRQSAIHIWKALVQNTPRTVREILPALVDKIVELLANAHGEQQETSARTVGELCRKFGERLVAEIIPLLQKSSQSSSSSTRTGVSLALTSIMENTTDTQREGHEDAIITVVRSSLVDTNSSVRSAAARAFDCLQRLIGARAIDQTIPTLLEALRRPGESSGTALHALREVMHVRATTVFPVLIPTLLATPITAFNLRALGSLVSVAGAALSKRISVIVSTLVKVIEEEEGEEVLNECNECLNKVFSSLDEMEGLNTLMMLLLGWAKHDKPKRRASAAQLFGQFCLAAECDFSLYRIDWIWQIIPMFDDPVVDVAQKAATGFTAFAGSIPKDEYEGVVVPIRRSIASTGSVGRTVPGFSIPNAVAPFVPILIAGLTTGSNEQRENAAYAISELIPRAEATSIKPFVIPFTGPLIRVATQATSYPPGVKVAILTALHQEVILIPTLVKPFFPQLQRTFAKAVGDTSSVNVRIKAGDALGELMKHQTRVDPLCTELLNGQKNNIEENEDIAASFVYALAKVVRSAHASISEPTRENMVAVVIDAFGRQFQDVRHAYIDAVSLLFGSLSHYPYVIQPHIQKYLISPQPSQLSSESIFSIMEYSPSIFKDLGIDTSIAKKLALSANSEHGVISRPAKDAKEIMKHSEIWEGDTGIHDILS